MFAAHAWHIGSTRGWGALTVRSLAEAVGVSTGLLYVHFEDKAALMLAVRRLASERLGAYLDAKTDTGDDCSAVRLCLRYVAFVHEHLWIYENDHVPLGGRVELPHRDAFLERARPHVAALGGDPERGAVHLWIGVHAVAMLTRQEPLPQAQSLVREHIDLWLRAIAR
jgi:AcrR family transcriptional regulator